ncbi:Uma2 family endonuclease [Komarekiella sp. 'clone 1']|uniref:Uma2 family endonuclease n=1 Tax=Komarekiella delphini-convector SJRDD-AB1 TaxID=2593771 RepID=A0AA40T0X2_9NOST|nr:Uma2 family endonuclease [Komarekiella delphini-convector]MBD6618598.1 Uma2 family endonuclease [Komarekiella delphini-convector SJRDD-AB1]
MTQTQTATKVVTFEEFIQWYPDNSPVRYELHNGVIIEMTPPVGKHEEIKGFLTTKLVIEYSGLNLPYFIPNQAIVKPPEGESGYLPDVLILNRPCLTSESLWTKSSTITQGSSIPLVIEVVSQNWRDDYYKKLADYEEMGIPEYWIVDYAAFGARKFIGDPKVPTFSLYELIDGEFQVSQFRGNDCIVSPTFPDLKMTANQIFQAGEVIED